jgi:hypothetical protein
MTCEVKKQSRIYGYVVSTVRHISARQSSASSGAALQLARILGQAICE